MESLLLKNAALVCLNRLMSLIVIPCKRFFRVFRHAFRFSKCSSGRDTIHSSFLCKCRIFLYSLIAFNEPYGPSAASYSNKQMQIDCAYEFYWSEVFKGLLRKLAHFIFPNTLWKLTDPFFLRPPTSWYNIVTFELNFTALCPYP